MDIINFTDCCHNILVDQITCTHRKSLIVNAELESLINIVYLDQINPFRLSLRHRFQHYNIIIPAFILHGLARKLYWLKPELIEAASPDQSFSGEKPWDFSLDENSPSEVTLSSETLSPFAISAKGKKTLAKSN